MINRAQFLQIIKIKIGRDKKLIIKKFFKAVFLFKKAIITAIGYEKIVIFSDYDADGIPGGVILHDLFEKIGFR